MTGARHAGSGAYYIAGPAERESWSAGRNSRRSCRAAAWPARLAPMVLDAACENGDLTREGVVTAFNELEEVDTGGLVVPIRGFELGKSPSLQSFILQPADVPGGATVLAEAFEGQFAESIAG